MATKEREDGVALPALGFLGTVRWMSMLSVTFPTASSLRLMPPDGGVAMAAPTPARLTTPHARATYFVRIIV